MAMASQSDDERPDETDIRKLVDDVVAEFLAAWDSSLMTTPFGEPEDEVAFRELLLGSTKRNAEKMWDLDKTDWNYKIIDMVKESAERHGKRCADFARRYHKRHLSLARVLAELKDLKKDCYTDITGKDGRTQRVMGFVCDI
jgi:hypothetical protein